MFTIKDEEELYQSLKNISKIQRSVVTYRECLPMGEGDIAQLAGERLLPHVKLFVVFPSLGIGELLATHRAGVGLFSW